MIQKIDNATVREAVQQAYERCKNETGGKNADYIPCLLYTSPSPRDA